MTADADHAAIFKFCLNDLRARLNEALGGIGGEGVTDDELVTAVRELRAERDHLAAEANRLEDHVNACDVWLTEARAERDDWHNLAGEAQVQLTEARAGLEAAERERDMERKAGDELDNALADVMAERDKWKATWEEWRVISRQYQARAEQAEAERDRLREELHDRHIDVVISHEQRAERDRLRAEVEHLRIAAGPIGCKMLSLGDGCPCRLCVLERERDRLRAALAEALEYVTHYGGHWSRCERRYGRDCSCGYIAALRAAEAFKNATLEAQP